MQIARNRRKFVLWVALGALLLGLSALWRFTALSDYLDPSWIRAQVIAPVRASGVAPLVVVAFYVIASFAMVPVTVIIVAVALAFGPWESILTSSTGSLAAALIGYWLGRRFGGGKLARASERQLAKIQSGLRDAGVLAVTSLRLLPIAPFTLVNVASGAMEIPVAAYVIGTLLGMVPGIVMISYFGYEMRRAIENPGPEEIAWCVGATVVLFAVSFALQKLMSRLSPQS